MKARVAHVATVDLSLRFLLLPQLRALRDTGFDVTTISAPGPWVPEIEAEGIRHIPWPHATRAWDPGTTPWRSASCSRSSGVNASTWSTRTTRSPASWDGSRRARPGSARVNTVHGL